MWYIHEVIAPSSGYIIVKFEVIWNLTVSLRKLKHVIAWDDLEINIKFNAIFVSDFVKPFIWR